MTETADGKEVYTTPSALNRPQKPTAAIPAMPPAPTKQAEVDEDDLDAVVPEGTACRRAGCRLTFVADEENRIGEGPGTKCVYHPGAVRTSISCVPYSVAEMSRLSAYIP